MTRSRKAGPRITRPKSQASSPTANQYSYVPIGLALLIVTGVLWLGLQRSSTSATANGPNPGIQPLGTVQAADYHSLAISPTDPNLLFFGHHDGVLQSTDGGRSWKPATNRSNFDAMQLAVSLASPELLWMAGHNVFFQSRDGGKNWTEVPTNLPGLDLHAFTVSSSEPNLLYAFAVGFGLFRSSDGGRTWESFGQNAPRLPTALTAGGTTEVLYIGTDQGLVVSRDQGQTFSAPVATGGSPVLALAASPKTDLLYAGTPQGLFRSDDGGQSWRKTAYHGPVAALAMTSSDPEWVVLVDPQGKVFGLR